MFGVDSRSIILAPIIFYNCVIGYVIGGNKTGQHQQNMFWREMSNGRRQPQHLAGAIGGGGGKLDPKPSLEISIWSLGKLDVFRFPE